MGTLFKWLIVVAAIATVVAFLPIGGHTILDRWHAAKSPGAFVTRGWSELKSVAAKLVADPEPSRKGVERPSRALKPAAPATATAPRPGQPVERHSQADREALDEIVAKHVGK